MRRPSLDAIRGFDRGVYIVAVGQLLNVFDAGLVYPFATIHFHLQVAIPLSIVGTEFLARNVATACATALGGYCGMELRRVQRPFLSPSAILVPKRRTVERVEVSYNPLSRLPDGSLGPKSNTSGD